jgi:hypothetical protein
MLQTQQFWNRITEIDAVTSDLARRELEATNGPLRRAELLKLLGQVRVLPNDAQTEQLAGRYLEAGVFSRAMINDALHVASAVLNEQDVLVSWNFRHLVNRRRRALVNQVNASAGFQAVEILAPPEV